MGLRGSSRIGSHIYDFYDFGHPSRSDSMRIVASYELLSADKSVWDPYFLRCFARPFTQCIESRNRILKYKIKKYKKAM